MNYCTKCGSPLQLRILPQEGEVPYCEQCQEYRFPLSNTAVSMIVLSPQKDRILLIQQYGKKRNILVAGYVDQKEALEAAMIREIKEELGRDVIAYTYLKSEYFEKSNTLMCNFAVVVDCDCLDEVSTWEIDHAQWYSFEEAKQQIAPDSLAQRFLHYFLHRNQTGIEFISCPFK